MTPHPPFIVRHWEFLTGLVVTLTIYLYGDTIKAFLNTRPQRIRLWVLKARIAGNKSRLVRLTRIKHEPSYAIFTLLTPAIMVVMLLFTILLPIYSVLTAPSHALPHKAFEKTFTFCVVGVAVVLWHTLRDFETALRSPDGIQKLQAKIERLRSRLAQTTTHY